MCYYMPQIFFLNHMQKLLAQIKTIGPGIKFTRHDVAVLLVKSCLPDIQACHVISNTLITIEHMFSQMVRYSNLHTVKHPINAHGRLKA